MVTRLAGVSVSKAEAAQAVKAAMAMAEAHPRRDRSRPRTEGAAAPGHDELTAATEDHGGGHAEPTAWASTPPAGSRWRWSRSSRC